MRTVEEIRLEISKVERAEVTAMRKVDRRQERLRELYEELAGAEKMP